MSGGPLWLMLFATSATLTGAGFLVEPVPFALAWLPLAGVLLLGTERRRAGSALIAGHFLWPALISGWGLVQLGYDPLAVTAAAACLVALFTALLLWLGLSAGSLLLAALPVFPANPLLVTGALLPGAGLWGLPALLLWVQLIASVPRLWLRASLLAALCLAPVLLQDRAGPLPETALREIDLSGIRALTERGHWAEALSRIEEGGTLILGENIIAQDDTAAVAWWCRAAKTRTITALIGVMGADGLGEVWGFENTESCPARLYRASVGIPFINDDIGTGYRPPRRAVASGGIRPDIDWLICFEAFSLWRWISLGVQNKNRPAVILANDRWTDPVPTARLRRKVARAFSALYGRTVLHADTGQTGVVWER